MKKYIILLILIFPSVVSAYTMTDNDIQIVRTRETQLLKQLAGFYATTIGFGSISPVSFPVTSQMLALAFWLNTPNGTTNITTSGVIKDPGKVVWVDLKPETSIKDPQKDDFQMKEKESKATINPEDLKSKVKADPTKFPKLNEALTGGGTPRYNITNSNSYTVLNTNGIYTNDIIQVNGTTYKVTTTPFVTGTCSSDSSCQNYGYSAFNPGEIIYQGEWSGQKWFSYQDPHNYPPYGAFDYIYSQRIGVVPFDSEVNVYDALKDSNNPNNLKTDFRGEIDDFITSYPNIVHFEDNNGNKLQSRGDVGANVSDAQRVADAANNYWTKKNAADLAKYNESMVTAAGTKLDLANARRNAGAGSDYEVADAQAAYDKAKAQAAASNAQSGFYTSLQNIFGSGGTGTGTGSGSGKGSGSGSGSTSFGNYSGNSQNTSVPNGTLPPKKTGTFDFPGRMTTFFTNIKTSPIFTFTNTYKNSLPSGSGISTVNVKLGRFGGSTSFDYSKYSSLYEIISTFVLIIFGWSAFKIITLKGS